MLKQTLYFGNPAKLSVRLNQLVITRPGDNADNVTITRPIEDIGILIIDNPQITMTSSVPQTLMRYGACLIVCDSRHIPSGLMLNMEGHSLQSERFRIHLSASLPLKKQLWQQTVKAKILNQAVAYLEITGEKAPTLIRLADNVKSGDTGNLEGQAASFYWRGVTEKLNCSRRDPKGEEPNSMLNYGYAIIRAMTARSLVASGMHPSLGIFHRNRYNAFCLADDIMEPFRPYVDILINKICRETPDAKITDNDVKRQLLSICSTDVLIDGKCYPMITGIAETAASLFKCFNGEARKIKYPCLSPIQE